MTSHDSGDDGDPDDAQLRSLRAVWLAMPDEDPPERGLGELMAAARVKADAMAKPSLWQRIARLLRRPPVLALATVVVFLGGAILIGNRTKDASEAPPAGAKPSAPQLEQRATDDQAGAGSAAAAGSGEAVKAPEIVTERPPMPEQQTPGGPPPPPPERPHTDHRGPAHTTATAPITSNPQGTVKGTKTEGRFEADDKAKREETVVGGAKNGLVEGDLDGEDTGATRGRFGDEAPREAPQGATVTAAPAKDTTATTTDAMRPTSRASQYVAQAKSALARGDCTAAKALMKRVAAEDTGLYKKTLAADPMLDRCMRK